VRLAFDDRLIRTTHFDGEMSLLADRHYSRRSLPDRILVDLELHRTVGAQQFLYSGRKLVLRNAEGTVLFGWIWPHDDKRMDGQTGYNCAIFRNESRRRASDIILEAEQAAFAKWGPNRLYTYIDPAKTAVIKCHGERIVGFSFRKAGWKPLIHKNGKPHLSKAGQWLFVKPYHGRHA